MRNDLKKCLAVDIAKQELYAFLGQEIQATYRISSAKNGLGEIEHSECTPRGWHQIVEIIGQEHAENSVFIGRQWTGEIYSPELAKQFPNRDWILTRILRLAGLEEGLNKGPGRDSYQRYIYIHGTPDEIKMGIPGSHGCIRMRNQDVLNLSQWVELGTKIYIDLNFEQNTFNHWSIES